MRRLVSTFFLASVCALSARAQTGAARPPGGLLPGERWTTDFGKHTVPLNEIASGGPPKDGIPAIERPSFVPVSEADAWLSDAEPVAVVVVGAESKVYPLQILIWHEIVNDLVGDVPITVTFCPLCNTTLAFDRRLGGRTLDFGTTGRLRHSDLVMYDRQTETWWQQATGEGIVGRLAGERLTFVPAPVLSWADAKQMHPAARVLSRRTGYRRDYGRNPYVGYDGQSKPIAAFFRRKTDTRLAAKERVVAIWSERTSLAIPFSALRKSRVVSLTFEGAPLVVFWTPGTTSALDAERIAEGTDVGSTGVFRSMIDGRTLTFEQLAAGRGGASFRDRETGSEWNLAGQGVAGPMRGRSLVPVVHGNHFWFAWAAFRPDTRLVPNP